MSLFQKYFRFSALLLPFLCIPGAAQNPQQEEKEIRIIRERGDGPRFERGPQEQTFERRIFIRPEGVRSMPQPMRSPHIAKFRASRGPGQSRSFGPQRPPMAGVITRPAASERMREQLNVTDAQVAKFKEIHTNTAKLAIQEKARLQILQIELGQLKSAETLDRAAIDKKLAEVSDSRGKLESLMTNAELDRQSVFTQEQKDKLKQLMKSRSQRGPREQMMLKEGFQPKPGTSHRRPRPEGQPAQPSPGGNEGGPR